MLWSLFIHRSFTVIVHFLLFLLLTFSFCFCLKELISRAWASAILPNGSGLWYFSLLCCNFSSSTSPPPSVSPTPDLHCIESGLSERLDRSSSRPAALCDLQHRLKVRLLEGISRFYPLLHPRGLISAQLAYFPPLPTLSPHRRHLHYTRCLSESWKK